jgi:hypothetical protein
MLNVRLYRVSLLPVIAAIVAVAFAPVALPAALTSPLPAGLFSAQRAQATLIGLAGVSADHASGSPRDDALASDVAAQLRADGLVVHESSAIAATAGGRRRIEIVVATSAVRGSESGSGSVVLVADRSAPGASTDATLSGTAALLELARDLSPRGGPRTLTFVSTSGGIAGAALAAAAVPRPVDATIVIGNLAGARAQPPLVVPWSGNGGMAPLSLQETVDAALSSQLGTGAGRPGLVDELARFAVPLTVSDQGPFEDAGIPALLVQQRGELSTRSTQVSAAMLGGFGRAILGAAQALQHGGEVASASTRDVTLAANVLGGWTARLLCGLAILASALCAVDLLARARRRRAALARWFAWVLAWGLPFLVTGLYAKLLAWSGLLAHVPPGPVAPAESPFRGGDALALISVVAVFALACLARVRLIKGPTLDEDAGATAGAPVALLCLASLLAAALWLANPYTAALLALPLLVWVPVIAGEGYHSPGAGLLWLVLSLAPFGLVLAIEANSLGLGPVGFAWTWLLVFAGGEIGAGALLAVSLAGAVTLATAFVLVHPSTRGTTEDIQITVRGPATYAGPGSLGGTDSALRRFAR